MNKFQLSILLVITLYSCQPVEKNTPVVELDFSQSEIEKINAKKRDRGDTLVLTSQILEKKLPSTILGYTQVGETESETNKEDGMAWSVVYKKYKKENQSLKISLADYNGAYGLFAGATAVLGMENTDNEEEISKSIKFKNGKGWESYKKNTKEAFLIVAIDNRFLLNIEAENQSDTEALKSIVENLDIDALIEVGN